MNRSADSSMDRSRAPESGPVRPFEFPAVVSTSLPTGLEIQSARMAQVPLVTLALVLDAGETWAPPEGWGTAVLAGEALEGGSTERSGVELTEALENLGTGLSIRTGWDATTVSLTCVAERKEDALALLAETALRPAFPDEEVGRLKTQRLAAIRQREMDPGSLADDAADHFLYSNASPYARPLAGRPETVGPLNPEHLREFARGRYRPQGSGLVVVGDVTPDEVRELGETAFGDWAGRAPKEGGPAPAEPGSHRGAIVLVDRPGSVQSEIRVVQVGVPRSTSHFFPLKVFNAVLGGAFTSRLMLNLREDKGFTYGIRSRFTARRGSGPFTISTAVGSDVTAPALEETMKEVRRILDEGLTLREVERARDYIAGVFPLQLETTGQVAARLSELHVHGLPKDYFSTYREAIRSVTPEEAWASGRDVLRPAEMVVVVVGDADEVLSPLEALGLGSVEVLSYPPVEE